MLPNKSVQVVNKKEVNGRRPGASMTPGPSDQPEVTPKKTPVDHHPPPRSR